MKPENHFLLLIGSFLLQGFLVSNNVTLDLMTIQAPQKASDEFGSDWQHVDGICARIGDNSLTYNEIKYIKNIDNFLIANKVPVVGFEIELGKIFQIYEKAKELGALGDESRIAQDMVSQIINSLKQDSPYDDSINDSSTQDDILLETLGVPQDFAEKYIGIKYKAVQIANSVKFSDEKILSDNETKEASTEPQELFFISIGVLSKDELDLYKNGLFTPAWVDFKEKKSSEIKKVYLDHLKKLDFGEISEPTKDDDLGKYFIVRKNKPDLQDIEISLPQDKKEQNINEFYEKAQVANIAITVYSKKELT